MSKKSTRLKLIIDLHARQEQEALQLLGISQQKLSELQAQLDHLQKYHQEYLINFAQQQRSGMSVLQLMEFRSFADKLDKAIAGQQLGVSAQEQDLLRARKFWEERHQRTKSLQKVSDLARLEEQKAADRREQLEQDARASRSFRKDGIENA